MGNLKSREEFRNRVCQLSNQVAQPKFTKTVVIGDGAAGLMIGSGVVESSNRRVVTQRLKQAGMHWSSFGAEGVMALRAAYLSNSNRWSSFWSRTSTIQVS